MREYTQYYKDGKPCYNGFTVYGCGTSTFYKEIDKEEYDRLSAMSYGEVDKEIKSNLCDSIIYGYGYYGHDLLQENGMYFVGRTTGNSCDWYHMKESRWKL